MFAWVFLMRVLLPYITGNNVAVVSIRVLHLRIAKQRLMTA